MIINYKTYSRVDNVDLHIGHKVKLRRLEVGVSHEIVGEALGTSIRQVQKYEKGINRISSGNLYLISKTLNVPIEYFFDDVEGC